MTKFLLSCLAASTAASAMALPQIPASARILDKGIPEKSVSIRKAARPASEQRAMKKIASKADIKQQYVNPLMWKSPSAKASSIIYSEDFEGWDGSDRSWLPEGITLRHDSGREDALKWEVASSAEFSGLIGLTGNCMTINYCSDFLDEWLILPEVTPGQDMVLSFDIVNDALWYFSTSNVDWETSQYIGDKIIVFDQQVMVSEDNGENWTLLKSLAEDFLDPYYDYDTLSMQGNYSMRPMEVSLAQFAGKPIRLAFRYVGTDGNLSAIDNITIGNPPLQVSYTNPMGTLFLGMSKESDVLNSSILTGPVYKGMTFENTTFNYDASYTWSYMDADAAWQTSDDPYGLEVTYRTDYSTPTTKVNNLYSMPVLEGSAAGYSAGTFTRGGQLKAGGKGEYLAVGQTGASMLLDLGLTVADYATEGSQTIAVFGMPLFGYDGNVDAFWTDYTFGEFADEENYVKLDAYMDFFYTADFPIVIRGIHTPAYGRIKDGVKFKAEIVPLADSGEISETPLAVAECGFDDMTVVDYGGSNNYYSLNFTFDQPIVMDSNVCSAYIVRISGFNDPEHVEYFSPVLTENSNPDGYALGWIQKTIVMEGNARQSTTAVANYVGDCISFYIMLDAEYPWLEGPESVDEWTGNTATVAFDSSYAGEDLTFENMPAWLTAKAEGQYGETAVTFEVAMTDELKEAADVTLSAPGVSHTIKVNPAGVAGVAGIEGAAATTEIYNLSGLRVTDMSAPGIYILKDSKGNVRKVAVD
ncbi:MAG: BACON domain-containing protein [Bacteroides sp.]|nr:BACON domain-containing protein [Bacteroides sp.]